MWWPALMACLRDPYKRGLFVFMDEAQRVFSRQLLEAIADSAHERHAELKHWAGACFDAAAFDLDAINASLQELSLAGR